MPGAADRRSIRQCQIRPESPSIPGVIRCFSHWRQQSAGNHSDSDTPLQVNPTGTAATVDLDNGAETTFVPVPAADTVTGGSHTGSGPYTVTVDADNNFGPGDKVLISGVSPAGYNGTYTVLASPAPSAIAFSFTKTGTPGTYSSGGTVSGCDVP